MVKLAQANKDSLHAITLNLDYDGGETAADDGKTLAKIQRTLDKFKIDLDNYVSTTPMDDVLEKVGGSVGLPTVIVYDKSGKVAKMFDGQFSYEEDVNPLVDDLIAAEPSE